MIGKRIWLAGLALFALLSLIDFVQTYALITRGDGMVYEANPVANAWLENHGWGGLAAFKLGAVTVFATAAIVLAIRRPRAGAGVLALGCLALLSVTIYSSRLIANSDRPPEMEEEIVVIDLNRMTFKGSPRASTADGRRDRCYRPEPYPCTSPVAAARFGSTHR